MRCLALLRQILAASLALLAIAATACGGAGFDPQERIKGLRVLAVQKDNAYPHPGERVNLKLLYWDGARAEGDPRPIDISFYPCINPKGDLYFQCGPSNLLRGSQLIVPDMGGVAGSDASMDDEASPDASTEAGLDGSDGTDALSSDGSPPADATPSGIAPYEADHVKTLSLRIPSREEIIHPTPPSVTPYGLVYVLFSACAGHIELSRPGEGNGIPLVCKDGGNVLGANDFVPGYSSIYVYEERRNANPVIGDFSFDHASLRGSPGQSDTEIRHVPRCPGAGCKSYDLKVALDQAANQEKDPGSTGLDGQELFEQMWVAYYATGGSFDHALRLVNDASQGWNEDNGSAFTPPAEPGPLRIWAVVHDNRGGVAWLEGKIIVD